MTNKIKRQYDGTTIHKTRKIEPGDTLNEEIKRYKLSEQRLIQVGQVQERKILNLTRDNRKLKKALRENEHNLKQALREVELNRKRRPGE